MNDAYRKGGISRRRQKQILADKINQWIHTIKDARVQELCKRDVIVTGGSIASMLLGEKINDFDVYFKTRETAIEVGNYYCAIMNECENTLSGYEFKIDESQEDRITANISKESGVIENLTVLEDENTVLDEREDDELGETIVEGVSCKNTYQPVYISENAITLTDKLQIVLRFYGEPEEIHNNYDFIHAMCYYEHKCRNLVYKQEALESLLAKRIEYVGSLYPICSLFRLRKFIKRGWHVTAGEILKISIQISQLDLADPEVFREQLTGVDMLYFSKVIAAMENSDIKLTDSDAVIEIINRVFNR